MKNRNRIIQYAIAYSVSLAGLAFGAFSNWLAPVMPMFHNNQTNIDVSSDDMSWMVAMSSPGYVAGSLFVQFMADRLGRRATILISVIPFAIGTILVTVANKAWQLLVSRFLWGGAGGMYNTVVTLYLAELADKQIRGELITVTRTMFNLGSLLMMCIGPFLTYSTLNYSLITLPILHFIGCLWIPESPYFFLKEGHVEKAKKVLKKIRSYEGDKILEDDLSQLKAEVKNQMRHSSTTKELFTGKKYRKAIFISLGLKTAQLMTGQLVVSQYLGLIMIESNTTLNLNMIFIVFGIVRCVTTVMSSMLADRLGRRPLLLYSYLLTGICLIIIGIYFYLKALGYDNEVLKAYSFVPFVGLIACNVISTLGYYSVIFVVPAEIFPLNVKAIAMTCLSVFAGLLNFGVARGYQVLEDLSGLYGVFWFFGAGGILGAIFTYLYVPETKGKSLQEIQELFQGDLYEDDEVLAKLNINYKDTDLENDEREGQELKEINTNKTLVKDTSLIVR